jgi:hypothetical protein
VGSMTSLSLPILTKEENLFESAQNLPYYHLSGRAVHLSIYYYNSSVDVIRRRIKGKSIFKACPAPRRPPS